MTISKSVFKPPTKLAAKQHFGISQANPIKLKVC